VLDPVYDAVHSRAGPRPAVDAGASTMAATLDRRASEWFASGMTVPRRSAGGLGVTEDPSALARSPLLANIAEDDLKALVRAGRLRSWRPGELLFQRGDAGDGIYAVVSGRVRIILTGRDGSEVLVRALQQGDVFGELAALDGSPRSADAIAETDVRALHIAADRFRDWMEARPRVMLLMLGQLAYRLRTTNEQVAELGLLDVATRIAVRLKQRFEEDAEGGRLPPGVRVRINQAEMAAELGITRESVNKHLARLKARGIVDIDRGVVRLIDAAALDELAREG
jgi:CRP-like cAMP-binding protein